MSFLVELLIARHVADPNDIERTAIGDFLDHRIPALALEDRTGELIWLLFLMVVLRVELKAACFERLTSLEEPMCALLIRYAESEGLISGNLNTSQWDAHVNAAGLDGPMWLYAYEVGRLRIISMDDSYITDHSFFAALLEHQVAFLSIEAGVAAVTNAQAGRRIDNRHRAKFRVAFDDLDFDNWELGDNEDGVEDDLVDWNADY